MINYREAYDLFACNGILFNHESPRRGETFVTRKITRGVSRIKEGLQNQILLGNLNAKRDWGYAPEYCEGMWLMLQQEKPEDFVLATGEQYSVREFVESSFKELNIQITWKGEGVNEIGIDLETGKTLVSVDPKYYRPTEVHTLLGDATKAKNKLAWEAKTSFNELVRKMIHSDWEEVKTKGF